MSKTILLSRVKAGRCQYLFALDAQLSRIWRGFLRWLQLEQMHFAVWTNTFTIHIPFGGVHTFLRRDELDLERFLQLGVIRTIYFVICTIYTFYYFANLTNIFYNLEKYILGCQYLFCIGRKAESDVKRFSPLVA